MGQNIDLGTTVTPLLKIIPFLFPPCFKALYILIFCKVHFFVCYIAIFSIQSSYMARCFFVVVVTGACKSTTLLKCSQK